jgi:hypothetical protein
MLHVAATTLELLLILLLNLLLLIMLHVADATVPLLLICCMLLLPQLKLLLNMVHVAAHSAAEYVECFCGHLFNSC